MSLKIFDMLGKEVATLIHNGLMDEGNHEVIFNATNLTSGIYFYRLQVSNGKENFVSMKKLVVVK